MLRRIRPGQGFGPMSYCGAHTINMRTRQSLVVALAALRGSRPDYRPPGPRGVAMETAPTLQAEEQDLGVTPEEQRFPARLAIPQINRRMNRANKYYYL